VTEETRAQEGYDTPEQCKNNLLQEVGAEIAASSKTERNENPLNSNEGRWRSFVNVYPTLPDWIDCFGTQLPWNGPSIE
jgi:hypothetical protein